MPPKIRKAFVLDSDTKVSIITVEVALEGLIKIKDEDGAIIALDADEARLLGKALVEAADSMGA